MTELLICNAQIINEGSIVKGAVKIEKDSIAHIYKEGDELPQNIPTLDAKNGFLLPGVIDEHVHFREPGLSHKATIASESSAALAGGVTSFFDMPNTSPTTTTLEDWQHKMDLMQANSKANYACFFGATNHNAHLLSLLDKRKVCGIKLFMGASTGNMLVDREEALKNIFATATLPIMVHCEETPLITANAKKYKALYGEDPDIKYHPFIRSEEACYQSTALAVKLALETGATLHIAHLSTKKELDLFANTPKHIIAEACLPHLIFFDEAYSTLGAKIKCNPSIKTFKDREALRNGLKTGIIKTIATDHAPHLLKEKEGGALKATSGFPMIQFSLISMLDLSLKNIISKEKIVELMCHNPASIYKIDKRGFIKVGYKADLTLVQPKQWVLQKKDILSKCGWSPLEGTNFNHQVTHTWCNGQEVFNITTGIHPTAKGEALHFNR